MTLPTFGGASAPGILERHPDMAPDAFHTTAAATIRLVNVVALDRFPAARRHSCYWRRRVDRRVVRLWHVERVPIPLR